MPRRNRLSIVGADLERTASLVRDGRKLPPVVDGHVTLPSLVKEHGADWIMSRQARGVVHWKPSPCVKCGNRVFLLGSNSCPKCAPSAVIADVLRPAPVTLTPREVRRLTEGVDDDDAEETQKNEAAV